MTHVQWVTLVADPQGVIEYVRVGRLVSIGLAVLGGLGMLVALAVEIVVKADLPTGMVLIVSGALVAPLTGGQLADGISGALASRRISRGLQVGRRADDGGQP